MKTEIGIKENCSNSPDTSVWEGSGRQDPFCRKSRKTIYKYYLGEWVCRISFDENRYDNQGDMQKLHILSLIAFYVLGS